MFVELGVLQRGKIAFAWDEGMLVGLHSGVALHGARSHKEQRVITYKTTDIVALKGVPRLLTTKQICGFSTAKNAKI